MRLGHIGDVRRRVFHVVHQAGLFVRTNVRLHAEVSLVALLRLVHPRAALSALVLVLDRARCRDDRRVHDRAHLQVLALACQVRVTRSKIMRLQ